MSEFFKWDPTLYSVKVRNMDNEHIRLIEIMNQLYDKNSKKVSKEEIKRTLNELASYTITHFKNEEMFMQSIKYAGLANHKRIHEDLLTKFKAHMTEFEKSSAATLSGAFFAFLKVWLGAHIQGIDRKYGEAATKTAA